MRTWVWPRGAMHGHSVGSDNFSVFLGKRNMCGVALSDQPNVYLHEYGILGHTANFYNGGNRTPNNTYTSDSIG
jgi:hypothetical protein